MDIKKKILTQPVSPSSPKILMKTSASVPLPFTSAVKTLTTYLFTENMEEKKNCMSVYLILCSNFVKNSNQQ